jgi:hypothetical protein
MSNIREFNINKGLQKFKGDIKSYYNMLITFDSLTLDESLGKIYYFIIDQKDLK